VSEHAATRVDISTATLLMITDDLVRGVQSQYKTKRDNSFDVSTEYI
jgi:hypothetical protein